MAKSGLGGATSPQRHTAPCDGASPVVSSATASARLIGRARASALAGWRSTARSPRGRRPSTARRAGLEDQGHGLLGAVVGEPGAEHPAARAVATRLVRCQSEALAHHASTLAAARCAVNRKSELNELRAELAELRALIEARAARRRGNGHAVAEDAKAEVMANVARRLFRLVRARVRYGVLHNFGSAQVKSRGLTDEHYYPLPQNRTRML